MNHLGVLTSLVSVGLLGLAPQVDGHVKTVGDEPPGGETFVDEADTIALPANGHFVAVEIAVVVTVTAIGGDTVVFHYQGLPYDGTVLLSLGEESLSESNLPQGWTRTGTLRGAPAHGTFLVHVEGPGYHTYAEFIDFCSGDRANDGITLSIDGRTHNMGVCYFAPWTNTQVANIWHCQSFAEPARNLPESLDMEPCESPEHMAATIVRDTDGDGTADHSEVDNGAHPLYSESTPATDDDGDGKDNQDESFVESQGGPVCSGAYGVVIANSCGGYAWVSTLPIGSDQTVHVDEESRLWIWDAVCLPGSQGDYSDCKGEASNYGSDDTLYTGDWVSDGYGWRHVADVPPELPEEEVDYVGLCDESSSDDDGDGLPVFYLCQRRVTLHPDGSTDDDETGQAQQVGDPDDEDTDDPVDRGAILQQIEEVVELVEDPDEDGYSTFEEHNGNSDPTKTTSTPETDHDGDGEANGDEDGPHCSGVYNIVFGDSDSDLVACSVGFRTEDWPGPEQDDVVAGFMHVDDEDRIWIFDAYCRATQTTCQSTSALGPTVEPYTGTWLDDGWGWRYVADVPLLLPKNQEYLGPCDDASSDADGDGSPVFRLCQRNATVHPDGSIDDEETAFEQSVGDPDDGDPENPVPQEALLVLVEDPDEDGETTIHELDEGSNPVRPASRPDTDDDGDGRANSGEPAIALFSQSSMLCTGAYGIVVAPACGGYANPYDPGVPLDARGAHNAGGVYVDGDDVWVWDPWCEFGLTGGADGYDSCKGDIPGDTVRDGSSNYDASGEEFQGGFRQDGYGWRFMGQTGIFTEHEFDYVGTCDTATEDKDDDGIPVVHLCNRRVVVQPDGSFTDDEQSLETEVGDTDDEDERIPVDHDGIAGQVEQMQRFVNDTVEDVLVIVEEAQEEAERLQRDVDELHNETVQAVEDYQRLVGDLVNQTFEDVEERAQQLIDDLDDLVGLAQSLREEAEDTAEAAVEDAEVWRACTEEELGRYVAAVDASSSNETAFRIQLTEGAVRWQQRSLQCFDHVDFGALQPIMNQTFAQTRFLLNIVEGNLHSGNGLYNDTLAFAQERVEFILNATGSIDDDEIEAVEQEMAQLINRVERDMDSITNAAMREVLEAIQEGDPTLFDSLEDPSDAERGEEENRTASFFDQVDSNRGRIVAVVLLIMVAAAALAVLRRR